jgi:hypothetical protein
VLGSPAVRRRSPVFSVLVAALVAVPVASAQGALRTATFDPFAFNNSHRQEQAFDRSRATGATMVRLTLAWKHVAPQSAPAGFNARDPLSRHYNWGWFDTQVRMVKARGLEPFAELILAPDWASQGGGGTIRPDPGAYRDLAIQPHVSRGPRPALGTTKTLRIYR